MKQIILGTAGHIDHGKTALVKALTGIDTDRLKEEKERGITIELGFAYLDLPSGVRLGIVDVPGHERFVKHMVAGAGGIDIVALIIAADEGVMPQTREHLAICTLLGITRGVVVLTKIDLVDQELREMALADIRDFTKGTFLEGAPLIPVSAVTREGLKDLITALEHLVAQVEQKSADGIFRLPIDRVFSMKGFGTVVTGTLLAGQVTTGEAVTILPPGITAKVRGIQVHGEKAEQAVAGQRTAINLQGIEKSSLERGEVLLHPGTVEVTKLLDAEVIYLAHAPRPLKNGAMLRFHTGTSYQMATLYLLGINELKPGEHGYAQIRLQHPVVALPNDRFVLRGSSQIQTIGGGIILDAHPQRHKRFKGDIIPQLEALKHGSPAGVLGLHIRKAGNRGVELKRLVGLTNIPPAVVSAAVQELLSRREVIKFDREAERVIDAELFMQLAQQMTATMEQYHAENPLKPGIAKEELKSKLPPEVDGKLFTALLADLAGNTVVIQERDKVRLANHQVALKGRQRELEEKIAEIIQHSGLTPPSAKELGEQLGAAEKEIREILALLADAGTIVKLKEGIYYHREPLSELGKQLVALLEKKGKISTQDFKSLAGVSRKYAIPLAEYFDAIKLTVRVGDDRILRSGGKE
ncbi:MAG: selenocysteine-specific translation elongation factor [Deltaproteobacteria bacterium RBG_16_54_18]|nr:MAG: selenocysteine-specific translation elongation factor [Deltaproteobacteria bacterium RBG_16_54_18]